MIITDKLHCPYCDYVFGNSEEYRPKIYTCINAVCPKCTDPFVYMIDSTRKYHTTKNCGANGIIHNWRYAGTKGYNAKRECRRCGLCLEHKTNLRLAGFDLKQDLC